LERDSRLTIERMTASDMDLALEWAAAEGWNPGLHDAPCFHRTDPDGFFIARLAGEPVGVVSAVAYDDTFGFAGFYIVREEFRGQGIGRALAARALERLGGRIVGLDGVLEQQENYRRNLGARLAYRNLRYRLDARPAQDGGPGLVPVSRIPFEQTADYDARCFPVRRDRFLGLWLSMPQAVALASVVDGRLTGYGMVRACRTGWKIGPLFADDPETAHRIFCALCSRAGTGPLFLDVPEINPGAVALAETHGMTRVFETARMYTKGEPAFDLWRVFGVTSFELG